MAVEYFIRRALRGGRLEHILNSIERQLSPIKEDIGSWVSAQSVQRRRSKEGYVEDTTKWQRQQLIGLRAVYKRAS